MRHTARTHIAIASLLMLVLLALSAVPAVGAEPKRQGWTERYVHKMVNCLRTGGKVTRAGKCADWGSGKHSKYVAPLKYSDKISNKVSWPWARKSSKFTSGRVCWIGHSRSGSTVDKRFRQVSLTSIANGENMGCGLYTPKKTAIFIVRMWQREKAYNGSHWRQLKAKKFKSAGYGVAKRGAKSQIVVNFYGKVVP